MLIYDTAILGSCRVTHNRATVRNEQEIEGTCFSNKLSGLDNTSRIREPNNA